MQTTPTSITATAPTTAVILNAALGHRIERTVRGFEVINGWGYIGTFLTLEEARRAHVASNRPAPATPENPDGI